MICVSFFYLLLTDNIIIYNVLDFFVNIFSVKDAQRVISSKEKGEKRSLLGKR